MAIKTIKYEVNVTGITPATEQFGGIQGDHRVVQLEFTLANGLRLATIEAAGSEKLMYRFDVYDGAGGICSSAPAALTGDSVCLELEECHTRFGGKISVYLVITALSADNETQIELYSFPAKLRLKDRPEGVYQDGETHESITTLAEIAKINAIKAENSNQELQIFAASIEEKLKNGEFNGVGVKSAEIINGELIVAYTDGVVQNLGNVKGEQGDIGPQGEKGEDATVGKEKTASGAIISIAEKGFLADIKFTSTAPQKTKVRIYNENSIDEKCLVGEVVEGVEYEETAIVFVLVNEDTIGGTSERTITNFGEFVFNKSTSTPEEYGGTYVKSYIKIDAPSFSYQIPLQNMVEGNTYKFICKVHSESCGVDMDGNATNWNIIFDKIYVLNKDNSAVETVNADGSISTANIKPYTIAMFDDLTGDEAYYLDLSYVVSDFVTKAYVDNLVDDTKAYVDTLVGDIETLLGGI